jgi:HPt (histidine-containing phosphotransfer) domain-containing protein/PAS domain-containing protein
MVFLRIFLLILLGSSSPARGFDLSRGSGKDLTKLTNYLRLLATSADSLDDILRRPLEDWTAVTSDSINFGYSDETFWFRVPLPDCSVNSSRRILDVAYPVLDSVEVWAVEGSQRLLYQAVGGDRYPFNSRPVEHLNFAYDLGCEAQQTVYIRVKTTSSVQFPLMLWDYKDFLRENSNVEKIHILYFGIMLSMLIYNFFLMVSVRKIIYFFLFLLSYLCFQGTVAGLGFRYLWPDFPRLNDYMIDKPLICVLIAGFLFTASFPGTQENFPKFHRLMRIGGRLLVAWLLLSFFFSYSASITVITVMVICGIGLGLFLAGASIMKRVRQTRFLTLAWSSFLLGTMIMALSRFDVIPRNIFTENAHQIGSVLLVMLFSLALADQMNILRKRLMSANTKLEKAIRHIEGENLRLEGVVAERTADLRSKTRDLSAILDNLPQGVLAFDPHRRVLPTFSQSLKGILGTEHIAGADVFELLFQLSSLDADAIEQIQSTCEFCFGEDRINFELNRARLPDRLHFFKAGSPRFLELNWSPLCSENDVVEYLLLTISDVTELKILEHEASSLQQKTRVLEAMVDGSFPRLRSFLEHARFKISGLLKLKSLDVQGVHCMFREIHTIKGNARTFRLNELAQKAHEFEMDLSAYRSNLQIAEWQPVQSNLEEIQDKLNGLLDFMVTLSTDSQSGAGETSKLSFDVALWQRFRQQLQVYVPPEALKRNCSELEYVMAAGYFRKLGESFPTSEGKLLPRIVCEMENGLYLAESLASRIHDLVVHLIRNSIDHGIEVPEVRLRRSKPEQGLIVFRLGTEDGQLVIHYHDDGNGLDLQRIKQKALEKQLCHDPSTPLADALGFIFMPGFSTAEAVSMTSGRGVGMDVVRQEIDALKGSLEWTQRIDKERMPFNIRIRFGVSCFIVVTEQSMAASA